LAYNDDDPDGDGRDSHIDWTADRSGYYVLEVRAYNQLEAGDYTIDTDFARPPAWQTWKGALRGALPMAYAPLPC
jgi:hypothetical protein